MPTAARALRVLTALVALAVLAVAGCSSPSTRPASDEQDSLTELRRGAQLAPCPAPGIQATRQAFTQDLLPELTLDCLGADGEVALAQLTGVPTVLTLWATWCGPCREEMPAFQQVHEAANASRAALRVLGVVTEDPGLTRPLTFLMDLGVRFPSVVDEAGELAGELGVRGLPATIFLNADGTVAHLYNGPPLTYDALVDLIGSHLRVRVDG